MPRAWRSKRALHVLWACALGGALLFGAYVLFDPDLGTPSPLFHEFWCKSDLVVELADGYGRDTLTPPEAGLRVRITAEGEPQGAYFTVYRRESPDDVWKRHFSFDEETGEYTLALSGLAPGVAFYARAQHLDGTYCAADSNVIETRAADVARDA